MPLSRVCKMRIIALLRKYFDPSHQMSFYITCMPHFTASTFSVFECRHLGFEWTLVPNGIMNKPIYRWP